MPQGHPERHLVEAGPVDLARYAEELGARRALRSHLTILSGAPFNDQRDIAECLDVVDDCWFAEQAVRGWERWLDARQTALAFDGFQQRGFFAANVSAGAQPHLNVEGQSRAENISADDAGPARLCHCFIHNFECARIFSSDINITLTGAHGVSRDDHTFDDAVRVVLHQNSILESPGFGFVC